MQPFTRSTHHHRWPMSAAVNYGTIALELISPSASKLARDALHRSLLSAPATQLGAGSHLASQAFSLDLLNAARESGTVTCTATSARTQVAVVQQSRGRTSRKQCSGLYCIP